MKIVFFILSLVLVKSSQDSIFKLTFNDEIEILRDQSQSILPIETYGPIKFERGFCFGNYINVTVPFSYLIPNLPNKERSITFWIRPKYSGGSNYYIILSYGNGGSESSFDINFRHDSNIADLYVNWKSSSGLNCKIQDFDWNWLHVAVIVYPSYTDIYINATLMRRSPITLDTNVGTNLLVIGGSISKNGKSIDTNYKYFYQGNLEEIEILNYPLSMLEIINRYNLGKCSVSNSNEMYPDMFGRTNNPPNYQTKSISLQGISSITKSLAISSCYDAVRSFSGSELFEIKIGVMAMHSSYSSMDYFAVSFGAKLISDYTIEAVLGYANGFGFSEKWYEYTQEISMTFKFKDILYQDPTLNANGNSFLANNNLVAFSTQCGDIIPQRAVLLINIQINITLQYQDFECFKIHQAELELGAVIEDVALSLKIENAKKISISRARGKLTLSVGQYGGEAQKLGAFLSGIGTTIKTCEFSDIRGCVSILDKLVQYSQSTQFVSQIVGSNFLPESRYPAMVYVTDFAQSPQISILNQTSLKNVVDQQTENLNKLLVLQQKTLDDLNSLNKLFSLMTSESITIDGVVYDLTYDEKTISTLQSSIKKVKSHLDAFLDPISGIKVCFTSNLDLCRSAVTNIPNTYPYTYKDLYVFGDVCLPQSTTCTATEKSIENKVLKSQYTINRNYLEFENFKSNDGTCIFGCPLPHIPQICSSDSLYLTLSYILVVLIIMHIY